MTSTTENHVSPSPNLPLNKEQSTGTDAVSPSPLDKDVELQSADTLTDDPRAAKVSAFKSLGLLDRLLALWILLAMIIGILLGNFVPNTGPALQKGQFVGVSVPIGKNHSSILTQGPLLICFVCQRSDCLS